MYRASFCVAKESRKEQVICVDLLYVTTVVSVNQRHVCQLRVSSVLIRKDSTLSYISRGTVLVLHRSYDE